MSADTGAVDAAEAVAKELVIRDLGERDDWETRLADWEWDEYRHDALIIIAAYQRANAERVTALVDELIWAAGDIKHYGNYEPAEKARAALLLAVVGEEMQ